MPLAPIHLKYVLDPLLATLTHAGILLDQLGADEALAAHIAEAAPSATLHIIDRAATFDARALARRFQDRTILHPTNAPVALGLVALPDLLILAGDANWHTTITALEAAARRATRLSAPFPVVLAANAGWPHARRDTYADPESVPETYRQPHARGGVRPDRDELGPGLHPGRLHALRENQPRSGVLTALEDFLAAHPGGIEGRPRLHTLPALEGVAILVPPAWAARLGPWLESVAMGPAARAVLEETDRCRAMAEADLLALEARLALEKRRTDILARRLEAAPATDPTPPPRPASLASRLARRLAGAAGAPAAPEALPSADLEAIRLSPAFDAAWYLATYPDIARAGAAPAAHFLEHGARERRSPGPYFDTVWYLDRYGDVAEAGANPLLHYLRVGAGEGRDPSPHFATVAYLERYPDVREAGLNPLEHWIETGQHEGRVPR